MKKSAICYRSHFFNKRILKEYNKIVSECDPSKYEVVMLYDNSRKDFKSFKVGRKYALFDVSDLKGMGYRVHEEKIAWYNGDYPLLHFYKKNPDYPYYWMVEYDVCFNGRWGSFFDAYCNDDSDLIAAEVKHSKNEPWGNWKHHNLDVPSDGLTGIFFPVVRFSNRALKLLDEQYKLGNWGFCEVVVPTLLDIHGYKISDLGEKFCSRKRFRFRPTIPFESLFFLPKNQLYHPVKDIKGAAIDGYMSLRGMVPKEVTGLWRRFARKKN